MRGIERKEGKGEETQAQGEGGRPDAAGGGSGEVEEVGSRGGDQGMAW